jgi:glycosyltransferase involved in cell wall biosynthesis
MPHTKLVNQNRFEVNKKNQSVNHDAQAVKKERPIADIALLLEGTYPYIRGGVSSWVHQIITGLPDLTFALIFLGGAREHYGEPQYELPDNVRHLEVHYMMETSLDGHPRSRKGNPAAFAKMRDLHLGFKRNEPIDNLVMQSVFNQLGDKQGISRDDFLFSEEAWKTICDDYQKYCTEPSFIDYFWSVRIMHAPLFLLADVARKAPPVRMLHSISTGYAGLLGVMISQQRNLPFMISEHGIYTKERKIDLAQAQWIHDPVDAMGGNLQTEAGYIRQMWIRFFEALGRMAYQQSNPIISLYEGNRERQIKDGAPAEKCLVVPNGIDPDRFAPLREARPKEIPQVLGLLGRVVPIKDIKTYIRAMRIVCDELPQAEGWIIGPEDEDPEYVQECKDLVASFDLSDKVKFLGFQNIADILPKLGLMVLTSISEAQPLVILEGYAAGVPCIATDVGSCRELIEGIAEEDRALGAGGAVVSIADPEATAQAAIALLSDEEKWHQAQAAGLARVTQFYTLKRMFNTYHELYRQALSKSTWPESDLK